MHRTQIMLEEEQYRELRARARRQGASMGIVVRELLDEAFAREAAAGRGRGLREAKGCFKAAGSKGRRHDEYLYGER